MPTLSYSPQPSQNQPSRAQAKIAARRTEILTNSYFLLLEQHQFISNEDGDTYRITEKGKALAAQYREKV